ncbi:hypothetical protein A3Q56_04982 [Intoshia linei]|uniref:Putative zinc-finger domain-containing protein n=1 Tax=Intoshia linei TaxID=1819745 RepID=A0A177AZ65_9BILA|nr:hypothetical protein A3Q56_04982 [Intoshia linei]
MLYCENDMIIDLEDPKNAIFDEISTLRSRSTTFQNNKDILQKKIELLTSQRDTIRKKINNNKIRLTKKQNGIKIQQNGLINELKTIQQKKKEIKLMEEIHQTNRLSYEQSKLVIKIMKTNIQDGRKVIKGIFDAMIKTKQELTKLEQLNMTIQEQKKATKAVKLNQLFEDLKLHKKDYITSLTLIKPNRTDFETNLIDFYIFSNDQINFDIDEYLIKNVDVNEKHDYSLKFDYSSILETFKFFRYLPNLKDRNKLIVSPTYSSRLNPHKYICMFEINGKCNDDNCKFQHLNDCIDEKKDIHEIAQFYRKLNNVDDINVQVVDKFISATKNFTHYNRLELLLKKINFNEENWTKMVFNQQVNYSLENEICGYIDHMSDFFKKNNNLFFKDKFQMKYLHLEENVIIINCINKDIEEINKIKDGNLKFNIIKKLEQYLQKYPKCLFIWLNFLEIYVSIATYSETVEWFEYSLNKLQSLHIYIEYFDYLNNIFDKLNLLDKMIQFVYTENLDQFRRKSSILCDLIITKIWTLHVIKHIDATKVDENFIVDYIKNILVSSYLIQTDYSDAGAISILDFEHKILLHLILIHYVAFQTLPNAFTLSNGKLLYFDKRPFIIQWEDVNFVKIVCSTFAGCFDLILEHELKNFNFRYFEPLFTNFFNFCNQCQCYSEFINRFNKVLFKFKSNQIHVGYNHFIVTSFVYQQKWQGQKINLHHKEAIFDSDVVSVFEGNVEIVYFECLHKLKNSNLKIFNQFDYVLIPYSFPIRNKDFVLKKNIFQSPKFFLQNSVNLYKITVSSLPLFDLDNESFDHYLVAHFLLLHTMYVIVDSGSCTFIKIFETGIKLLKRQRKPTLYFISKFINLVVLFSCDKNIIKIISYPSNLHNLYQFLRLSYQKMVRLIHNYELDTDLSCQPLNHKFFDNFDCNFYNFIICIYENLFQYFSITCKNYLHVYSSNFLVDTFLNSSNLFTFLVTVLNDAVNVNQFNQHLAFLYICLLILLKNSKVSYEEINKIYIMAISKHPYDFTFLEECIMSKFVNNKRVDYFRSSNILYNSKILKLLNFDKN